MFKLKAINARGICLFDIEIIVVVVKVVYNFDPEWIGITESAVVYTFNVQVGVHRGISPAFEDRIDLFQAFVYMW